MTDMEDSRPGTAGSRTIINHELSFSSLYAAAHPSATQAYNIKQERDAEQGERRTSANSLWSYLTTDVDSAWCTGPLTAFCFITGYIDAIAFSAMFIWCGPQTGNVIQLAMAVARLFEGSGSLRDMSFRTSDQQALCSLIAFNVGVFLGRIGDRIGAVKRIWLIGATFIQALFTLAAAIAIWQSHEPSIADSRTNLAWTNVLTFVGLSFMSMSLGLQGVLGKRLDTNFGCTIPLTTLWVELGSDPRLFKLRHKIATRDHKTLAIIAFFIGGFCGRALAAQIGAAGTLGIGAGLRALVAISWIFVPSKSLTH